MSDCTASPAVSAELSPWKIEALHISKGNAKTGAIPNYSTLPGAGVIVRKDGRPVTGEAGTCSGVCDACAGKCYAFRALRYPETARAWSENTTLIRDNPARVAYDIHRWIKRRRKPVPLFRFHVGGEFMPGDAGLMELYALADLAQAHPETVFFGYTKRTDLLARYRDTRGEFPGNLRVLASMWKGTVTNHTGAPEFHYDDGTAPELARLPHCQAVGRDGKPTGKTCSECRMCPNARPGMKIAVYAH